MEAATVALLGATALLLVARIDPGPVLREIEWPTLFCFIGLLWLSAIISAIVHRIPCTATMVPLVIALGSQGIPIEPAWLALALGGDLGGNGTTVGASANVVVISLAAGAGHPIIFRAFLRDVVVVFAMSLVRSSIYLWLRYLL